MKPEIKAKWVAALKSGEYEQGKGTLRTASNKFCCLGVLCDIHARETGQTWTTETSVYPLSYCAENLMLPGIVVNWAGLWHKDPKLGDYACSIHNDGNSECTRKSFPEIADLIEANL